MALRIDTKKMYEAKIDGEVVLIRTLTGRQRMDVLAHAQGVGALLSGRGEEDVPPPETTRSVMQHYYEILAVGLAEDPDLIDPRQWPGLVREVLAANELTGDDRGNSPSP